MHFLFPVWQRSTTKLDTHINSFEDIHFPTYPKVLKVLQHESRLVFQYSQTFLKITGIPIMVILNK